jgi:hypothetical protein
VDDVVCVRPAGWPVAAGKRAAAVAQHEGAAQRAGDQAALAANIEHLPGAAEHRRQDCRVARQPPNCRRGESNSAVQRARGKPTGERVVVSGDDDLQRVATVLGQLVRSQHQAADLGQRIVAALARRAVVRRAARPAQRIEHGVQQWRSPRPAARSPALGRLDRLTR